MFGVSKERLVKSLCRLSSKNCGYLGSRCDCKYMGDPPNEYAMESSGCSEMHLAAKLIGMMTGEEFYLLAARAGIDVDPQQEIYISVDDFLEEVRSNDRNFGDDSNE